MLRCFTAIFMVTWCLEGALALPIHRAEWSPSHRSPTQRISQRTARHPAPVVGEDADQSAEASSIVGDYVPHRLNQFSDRKFRLSRPDVGYNYPSPEQYPSLSSGETPFSDCPNCKSVRQGIVTLGESRSYSIVTHPQKPIPEHQELSSEEPLTTVTMLPEETTEVSTTEATTALDDTVISVRVSSSVGKSVQQLPEAASLLTEERPFATAVQRSHFSVEEAEHEAVSTSSTFGQRYPASKLVTSVSVSSNFESQSSSTAPPVVTSTLGKYPTPSIGRTDRSLYLGNTKLNAEKSTKFMFGSAAEGEASIQSRSAGMTDPQTVVAVDNISPPANPLNSPVSYHTSLKSATSGSSVSFYREPPSFRSGAQTLPSVEATTVTLQLEPQTERLKHETRVETVSFHQEVVLQPREPEKAEKQPVDKDKSYQFTNVHDNSFHHVQVTHLEGNDKKRTLPYTTERRYAQPEKVYGMPEQNYEVDEALSLRTNGRAHGVQGAPTTKPDNNKFGYVVEGRDFKKYRVEERTSDGFIVGEYGVVRNDNGNLRGVRYTADSTINPKVIYEALVKFLSL